MMPNFSFNPGTELLRNGEPFVVDSSGPRGVAMRPKNPDLIQVVPVAELQSELHSGALVVKDLLSAEAAEAAAALVPVPKGLSEYSEKIRKVVAMRKRFLREICPTGAMRYPRRLLAAALRDVWSKLPEDERELHPPSKSSFYKWRRSWINSTFSDLSLLPRWDKRGRRPNAVPPVLLAIMQRLTEEKYQTAERPTVAEVWRLAKADVDKANRLRPPGDRIPTPTLVQMRRVIDSFDPERLLMRRYGKAMAHNRTRVYRAGPGALRLLERVEVDHTRLNIICVSSETHAPLGRPWLTIMIDVASRMIVGVWISFYTPNANTVLRVLKQAIRPKNELLAKFKLKGVWPARGVPLALVMDNGLEFHSKALDAAAEDLGISLVYCPSREPRFKGVVERFMRTINTGLVHTLPGTTFSNPADRGDYDSEACAVLTIDETRQLVFKWIVEQYLVNLHRGINAAPLQRWLELEAVCPPQMPNRIEALDTYLRPLETRALSKKGIEFNSLFYVSPELDELRRRNGLRDRDVRLGVRANPDDIGAIQVLHPDDDVYFTASCTRPDYAKGMTLEQHKFHKKCAAQKYAQLDLMSGLLASKQEICETVDGILKQGRARQKAKDVTDAVIVPGKAGSDAPSGAPSGEHAARPRKPAGGAQKRANKNAQLVAEELASQARDRAGETDDEQEAVGSDLEGDDFESYDSIEAFGEREPELF